MLEMEGATDRPDVCALDMRSMTSNGRTETPKGDSVRHHPSPAYASAADDSGFYDLCPNSDVDESEYVATLIRPPTSANAGHRMPNAEMNWTHRDRLLRMSQITTIGNTASGPFGYGNGNSKHLPLANCMNWTSLHTHSSPFTYKTIPCIERPTALHIKWTSQRHSSPAAATPSSPISNPLKPAPIMNLSASFDRFYATLSPSTDYLTSLTLRNQLSPIARGGRVPKWHKPPEAANLVGKMPHIDAMLPRTRARNKYSIEHLSPCKRPIFKETRPSAYPIANLSTNHKDETENFIQSDIIREHPCFSTKEESLRIKQKNLQKGVDTTRSSSTYSVLCSDISDVSSLNSVLCSDISDVSSLSDTTASDGSSEELETPLSSSALQKPRRATGGSTRKSFRPVRSPLAKDPVFRGATVRLRTAYQNGTTSLQITAVFSNVERSRGDKVNAEVPQIAPPKKEHPVCTRNPHYSLSGSSKTCASCKTRRTPLWRDSEDWHAAL
ncbi:uncharacterized protein LOC127879709 [Dreissena polymorpha]|uniref:Uncharacterized protein n=1 Tax=Dreissena polymorpha TaxID=45954 RepID=A0A9D4QHL7_DREPO|nr:uncharacterized protein LOC127879709 [Dreissena polymorpha]KAH3832273.1 hypothetical protein DPMN_105554 [Dreissena polymorpha]